MTKVLTSSGHSKIHNSTFCIGTFFPVFNRSCIYLPLFSNDGWIQRLVSTNRIKKQNVQTRLKI